MINTVSPHLTDNEFAECLNGTTPTPGIAAHLASCDLCREELTVFLTSVDSLSGAALEWSRSQPVGSPRADLLRHSPSLFSPSLRWAVAAILLLGVSIPAVLHHERRDFPVSPQAALSAPEDSPAQIARDNQLMKSVNIALENTDPSPFSEYGLAQGHLRKSTSGSEPIVR
jgi:hypothetical protein